MLRAIASGWAVVGAWAALGALGAFEISCQQLQKPTPPPSDQAAAASVDSSVVVASSTPLASLRRVDGCWGNDLPPSPSARLELLGKRCAQGMTTLVAPSAMSVGPDGADWTLPKVASGACIRVAGVLAGGIEVTLYEADGRVLAADHDGAFAMAPLKGPACVSQDGSPRVHLRRLGAESAASVAAWVSTP